MSSTRSDSRAKCHSLLLFILFTFFISPQQLELSRDESRRWFQSADPWKSPSGSLTPLPSSRASREFRSGKRKSGELRWWKGGGKKSERMRERGTERKRGWRCVFHIGTLLYSSYPLAISFGISPSRLIELLVYTYTTHNDSRAWERKEPLLLSFIFFLLLSVFISPHIPFSLSLSKYHTEIELENIMWDEVKQGDLASNLPSRIKLLPPPKWEI